MSGKSSIQRLIAHSIRQVGIYIRKCSSQHRHRTPAQYGGTLVGYYTSNCFGWSATSTTNVAVARASDYITPQTVMMLCYNIIVHNII